ncbi:hypothetical protein ACVIGB_010114 [Bradyrhizobium sp. USDA 4341]
MAQGRLLLAAVVVLAVSSEAHSAGRSDDDNGRATKLGVFRKAAKPSPHESAVPFFLLNDNRITYSWGTVGVQGYSSKSSLSTLAFTHFDVWAYGTNMVNLLYSKLDHSAPTAPCVGSVSAALGDCAGAGLGIASVRSTFGWNELFDTKAFAVGPLTNISFLVGADISTSNLLTSSSSRAVSAGLQFSFDLPYRGYLNMAPVYHQKWEYSASTVPPSIGGILGTHPPFIGFPDGVGHFNPTWGIDLDYYMELGFLPEAWRYFSVSGYASVRGPQGSGGYGAIVRDPRTDRVVSLSAEPVRFTLDMGKLFWGPKYSHLVDVWTSWRYSKNDAGYSDAVDPSCIVAPGAKNGSCTGGGFFYGLTMKVGEEVPGSAAPSLSGQPFFKNSDNRLTAAVLPSSTSPGQTAKTQKQVYAFSHEDVWAYGANVFRAELLNSDHRDPSAPCTSAFSVHSFGTSGPCAGNLEFNATLRSTFGFNELFGAGTFKAGPLRNVSALVGADFRVSRSYEGANKKAVVAGVQFAFDLPYQGYLHVAPLYYQEWNHSIFAYPNNAGNTEAGFGIVGYPPYTGTMAAGFTGTIDGNLRYRPTWALEIDYGMELGFLPESMQYFSVNGRVAIVGPKGNGAYGQYTLPPAMNTAMEINAEPVRLTFDVSKALWGQTYSHFIDTFVAYRYWKNKFGLDGNNPANGVCFFANGTSNRSCSEQTVYTGVSMKF